MKPESSPRTFQYHVFVCRDGELREVMDYGSAAKAICDAERRSRISRGLDFVLVIQSSIVRDYPVARRVIAAYNRRYAPSVEDDIWGGTVEEGERCLVPAGI